MSTAVDTATRSPIAASATFVTGSVHGGQQPVSNATIQLYTVGTTGLKSAATPLLTATVTTSDGTGVGGNAGNSFNTLPAGSFTITGDYSCASATQVYLVATGGNSSAAPDGSPTNSAIALMAPLGSCTTLLANAATTFVQINELTTVASAYALAPFMSGYGNVGASGSNPTGLVNAIANFNNLANVSSGGLGGANLPADAVLPATELNTLGDILAACVNTAGPTSASCAALLSTTGSSNTIGAALAFANNPGSSALTALWTLATATAPFQPTLTAAPTDWTVAIKYPVSSALKSPYGLAIDAAGNVWISNVAATSQPVIEVSSTGVLVASSSGAGLIGPKGIAIDRSGSVWVTNPSQNSVAKLSNLGVLSATYTTGGLNGPVSIAMDSKGDAWIANLTGNSVTELNSSGTAVQTGLSGAGTISGPTGISLDSSGNVYVANSGNGNVVKLLNATGAPASGSPFTDVALQGTTSVAVDTSGNVWATGSTTGASLAGAVSQFSSAGAAASYSPLANGGLSLPVGSAVAGTSLWVTNGQTAGTLSQLVLGQSTPSSPATGFGSLNAPVGVAVSPSGDVWTANSGDNTVTQFIGLASPVTTPIAANVGP